MPVVQVFTPMLDDVRGALDAVCREVADALELRPSDVIATHVPVTACVMPGHLDAQWPVVVLHGSPRPPEQLALARDRVAALVESWFAAPGSGSWVTWQHP